MAVVDTWYTVLPRATGQSPFASYFGAFMDTRWELNRQLIAQELKRKDPDYLLKMAMEAQKQIGVLRERQASIALAREQGNWTVAREAIEQFGSIETTSMQTEGIVERQRMQNRGDVVEYMEARNTEARTNRSLGPEAQNDIAQGIARAQAQGALAGPDAYADIDRAIMSAANREGAAPGSEKFAAIAAAAYEQAASAGMTGAAAYIRDGELDARNQVHGGWLKGMEPAQHYDAYFPTYDTPAKREAFIQEATRGGVRPRRAGELIPQAMQIMQDRGFLRTPTSPGPSAAPQGAQAPPGAAAPAPAQAPAFVPAPSTAPQQVRAPGAGVDPMGILPPTAPQGDYFTPPTDPLSGLESQIGVLQAQYKRLLDEYAARSGDATSQRSVIPQRLGINWMLQAPATRRSRKQDMIDRAAATDPRRAVRVIDEYDRLEFDPGMGPQFGVAWNDTAGSRSFVLGWIASELERARDELGNEQTRLQGLSRMADVRDAVEMMGPHLPPSAGGLATGLGPAVDQVIAGMNGRPPEVWGANAAAAADVAAMVAREAAGAADEPFDYVLGDAIKAAESASSPEDRAARLLDLSERWSRLPAELTGGPSGIATNLRYAIRNRVQGGDAAGLAQDLSAARRRAYSMGDTLYQEGFSDEQKSWARPQSSVEMEAEQDRLQAEARARLQPQAPAPEPAPLPAATPAQAPGAPVDTATLPTRNTQDRVGTGYAMPQVESSLSDDEVRALAAEVGIDPERALEVVKTGERPMPTRARSATAGVDPTDTEAMLTAMGY